MSFRINQANDAYDRKTEEYIIAFIDFLGTTNLICSDSQNDSLNYMHNLYQFSIDISKKLDKPESDDLVIKVFSDNIVLAKKLSTDKEQRYKDIACLIKAAARFQITSVSEGVGYLVRGGITIGDLFVDEMMVYGKALVKAYGLESKTAIYPRIVFDKKTAYEIKKYENLLSFINEDFDGVDFLNYLNNCYFMGEYLQNAFQKMKFEASKKTNERILQNLNWHKNYVNKYLIQNNEKRLLDMEDLIEKFK